MNYNVPSLELLYRFFANEDKSMYQRLIWILFIIWGFASIATIQAYRSKIKHTHHAITFERHGIDIILSVTHHPVVACCRLLLFFSSCTADYVYDLWRDCVLVVFDDGIIDGSCFESRMFSLFAIAALTATSSNSRKRAAIAKTENFRFAVVGFLYNEPCRSVKKWWVTKFYDTNPRTWYTSDYYGCKY